MRSSAPRERRGAEELYRLKGELLQKAESKVQKEAEEYFCQALDIARQRDAKSWELRAVMSLSQLWQGQGKREEARQSVFIKPLTLLAVRVRSRWSCGP